MDDQSHDPAADLPAATLDVVDAGSRRGVRAQRKKRKRVEDRAGDFWRQCLGSEIGRAEIWTLLTSGGAFTAPFQVGPSGFPQREATWFRAGQQALCLGLYQRLMLYDFDAVRLMLQENDPLFKAQK